MPVISSKVKLYFDEISTIPEQTWKELFDEQRRLIRDMFGFHSYTYVEPPRPQEMW